MVSFIVPCYNEQDNVQAFYDAFAQAFDGVAWQLVMVDDGSSDQTYERLELLGKADRRVTVISFSRNFGKEAAIYAGLCETRGASCVGIIDADLQQPPATARQMLDELQSDDSLDCVAAYQESRRENPLMNLAKRSFYKVFARASRSSEVLENASDFRVFRREVADAILAMPEYHRFSKGIFSWVGFVTKPFPYTPSERNAGSTKWSFSSLMSYAIEGILSFSTRPLHMVTTLGCISFAIAVVYAVVLIVKTLVRGVDVPGYASTIALILGFGGMQLLSLGIIGEYLARLYEQEKNRPIYLVRRRLNSRQDDMQNRTQEHADGKE